MSETELGRITASTSRRVFGAGAMLGLGSLLVYIGAATAEIGLWGKIVLLVIGILAVWMAGLLWNASAHQIIVTQEAVIDSDGTVIAEIENIAKVDRSVFAMKPSNGFLLLLKEKQPVAWRPGLWWRWRKRVAIGGVVSGAQTKPVADQLTVMTTPEQI